MALNFYELAQSRPLERAIPSASITLKWVAMHAAGENVVYAALLNLVAPPRWDGLPRSKVKLDPRGGGVWMCDVEYAWGAQTQDSPEGGSPSPAGPLGPEWQIDGTAGTTHLNASIKTVSKTGRGGVVPFDNKQAIGLTYDRVEGVDVFTPKLDISLTLSFPFVTQQRVRTWSKMTARVNNAAVGAWEKGELLYLGPSVTIQPGQITKVTHKFAAGRNLKSPADTADLTIVPDSAPAAGDGLVVPEKKAWDYLWVAFAFDANPGPAWVPQVPQAAYVEQVYREADFNELFTGV